MRILRAAGLVLIALVFSSPGACSYSQEYYRKLGQECVRKRDDRAAVEHFRLALQVGEPNYVLYELLAEPLARLEKYDEAIEYYKKVARLLQDDVLKYTEQARKTTDHLRCAGLLRLCDKEIVPSLSRVHMKMGMVFELKQDHASALEAYQQALFDIERNLRARMNAARLYERKGDTEAAMNEWQLFILYAKRASREDKLLYDVKRADVKAARKRVEKLSISSIRRPTGKDKEKN